MRILGVKIDNLSKLDILKKIEFFLNEKKFHQVATVNPEFILKAQEDEGFKNILDESDLNVADGFGIKLAFLVRGKLLKTRFPGIDLVWEVINLANQEELPVFLAGSKDGLSGWEETRDAIHMKFPTLQINGLNLDRNSSGKDIKIEESILLCNFGAPEQEKFINSVKNDNIRLAVGVGGSFDFITGRTKRAPKIMQKLGLEWLWRLILEPKYRIKKILKAVVVFPVKVLISRK